MSLALAGCSQKPSSKPALRDAIVYDATSFNAYLSELSFNPDARYFVNSARLSALENFKPLPIAVRSKGTRKTYSGIFKAVLLNSRISLNPDKQYNRDLIYRLSMSEGIDPTYMDKLALRESGLDNFAHAPTSSASGMFQFTENTWLCAMRLYGADYGISKTETITRDSNGRCRVADRGDRTLFLSMRYDAALSTKFAIRHTLDNKKVLDSIGRPATYADLYALHFFGQAVGIQFLTASPYAYGYQVAPQGARANPSIFYRRGRPRMVWEIYQDFARL